MRTGALPPSRAGPRRASLLGAVRAVADQVAPEELDASSIIPSVFDPAVADAVAQAVMTAPID